MKNSWIEVSCTVPEALVEPLAELLVNLSGTGVSIENLNVDTFSVDTIENSPTKTLKAYFPPETEQEFINSEFEAYFSANAHICPDFTLPPVRITHLREEDWANNWKKHFKPSCIGKHLVIKPTWEAYDQTAGDVIIEIDPGQAFGTGTHATTRLCLETLENIFLEDPPFDRYQHRTPRSVLDVGTGSGVLSIAAAKLGAERIEAIDIDPDAVTVARENIALNHVTSRVSTSATLLQKVEGTYDLVVANIIAEELVKLAPQLIERLRRPGFLVLSGILTEREQYVVDGFSPFPLVLRDTTRREEWSCLVYAAAEPGA